MDEYGQIYIYFMAYIAKKGQRFSLAKLVCMQCTLKSSYTNQRKDVRLIKI